MQMAAEQQTEKKIRLLVLIDRYLPILGGAQNNVHELCCELKQRGFSVKVITRVVYSGLKKTETIDGVNILRFASIPFRIFSKFLFVIQSTIYLIRCKTEYDAVLAVPCALYPELLPPFFASLITKKPYIIRTTCYNNFDKMLSWKSAHWRDAIKRIFFPPFLWRAVLKRASTIVALNNAIYAHAKEFNIQNCQVILSGVDQNRFYPADKHQKAQLRKKLNLPTGKTIITTAGRYVDEKNQKLLIEAGERLERGQYAGKILILIIGATEKNQITSVEKEIKEYVKENNLSDLVIFVNDVTNVEDYFRASDIFVQPSMFSEGLSRVMLEGMACGLPVICSDLLQNTCIFPNEQGYFFEPTDVNELISHLKTLIDSPEELSAFGDKLATFAQEHYTAERVAENYYDLFSNLQ